MGHAYATRFVYKYGWGERRGGGGEVEEGGREGGGTRQGDSGGMDKREWYPEALQLFSYWDVCQEGACWEGGVMEHTGVARGLGGEDSCARSACKHHRREKETVGNVDIHVNEKVQELR